MATTSLNGNPVTNSRKISAASLLGKSTEAVDNSVTLTIKVVQATSIKGAKGEHVNSFVRTQFADFDFKDVMLGWRLDGHRDWQPKSGV